MDDVLKHLLEFDRARGWNQYEMVSSEQETVDLLYRQLVHLLGEIGEFANEVKKCSRDGTFREEKLKEELTDSFIFLLKISKTLKMNLREEYFKKMRVNEERFPVKVI